MKIKITADEVNLPSGKYVKGAVVEVSDIHAGYLIDNGYAVEFKDEPASKTVAPAKVKKSKNGRRK